ncbi:MAG: alkaline phosphatase family protein [Verrucomicrobia bacterium]|nr:alkaline phosphatase family protein [Cytophagales bacterium]
MRKNIFFLLIVGLLTCNLQAQNLLQSGPMVGYSEMKEVMLWVQTKTAASVKITYFEKDKPQPRFETQTIKTEKQDGYTAHLLADQVIPGKKYTYELYINGKKIERSYPMEFQTQTLWQYRTDPPDFKFAAGSCTYVNETETDRPGKPYGDGYQIFTQIAKEKPDFMLWLGDNMYLREPDFYSWTGILHRNTHTRSLAEMQPLLASTHNYAIWDDHDFGPNDGDRSFWGKEMTKKAFQLFWANPNYGVGNTEGLTGTFMWADCQFFLLDDRWYKTPNDKKTGEREILGEKQLKWLIDALAYSEAPFKFVCIGGQVLNSAAVFENFANYAEERQKLIDAIKVNKIPGVIFMTGDRHHTELSKIENIYDLTVSPLTSGTANPKEGENANQVAGTLIKERNYATLEVKGARRERVLTIRIVNNEGKELWKKDITAKELRYE